MTRPLARLSRALVAALALGGSLALVGSAMAGAMPASRGYRHRFDWWGQMIRWSDGE